MSKVKNILEGDHKTSGSIVELLYGSILLKAEIIGVDGKFQHLVSSPTWNSFHMYRMSYLNGSLILESGFYKHANYVLMHIDCSLSDFRRDFKVWLFPVKSLFCELFVFVWVLYENTIKILIGYTTRGLLVTVLKWRNWRNRAWRFFRFIP